MSEEKIIKGYEALIYEHKKERDNLKAENAELKLQNETLTSCLEYEKDGRMKYQEELSKIPYCVEACKRCDYLKLNAELKAELKLLENFRDYAKLKAEAEKALKEKGE